MKLLVFSFAFCCSVLVRVTSHVIWQPNKMLNNMRNVSFDCMSLCYIKDKAIRLTVNTYSTSICHTFILLKLMSCVHIKANEHKTKISIRNRNCYTWVQYNHAYLVVCQAIKLKQIDYIC